MAKWKVCFKAEIIVEADTYFAAVDLAKRTTGYLELQEDYCYELTENDLDQDHNKKLITV